MALDLLGGLVKRPIDLARCAKVASGFSALQKPERPPPKSVLLSRGAFLYRWLSLGNVPRGKQAAVISAQLLAWSPFEDCGFRAVVMGEAAGLFAWDQKRLSDLLGDAGFPSSNTSLVVPECWLVAPPPSGAGVRLVQGFDGYEGQVWVGGSLRASRFWAELPEELEWSNFLRGASVLPEALVARDAARVGQPGWQASGWGRLLAPQELQDRGTVWERRLLIWAFLALVAASTLVAKVALQQRVAQQQAELRLAALRLSTVPVLKARDSAIENLSSAMTMLELLKRPEPLRVLAHVAERLGNQPGVTLREFDLNDGSLRLVIAMPSEAPRSALVKSLEAGAWLVGVTESVGSSSADLVLTMRLNGFAPLEVKASEPNTATVR